MAGATRAKSVNILRTLYRELRPTVNEPQKHVYETQLWKYIVGLCRECRSYSPSKMSEAQKNLEETGRSYVFYLQSYKEYHRICDDYKGAGERTAQATATMMGFKMPHEPRDPPKEKANKSQSQSSSDATETTTPKISCSSQVSHSSLSGNDASIKPNLRTELSS